MKTVENLGHWDNHPLDPNLWRALRSTLAIRGQIVKLEESITKKQETLERVLFDYGVRLLTAAREGEKPGKDKDTTEKVISDFLEYEKRYFKGKGIENWRSIID